MPDDTATTDASQADASGSPQPQAGATTTTEPQAGDSQEPMSLEEAKKLRSEANSLRQRLRSAEAKAKELDDFKAKLEDDKRTDKEKLEARLAEVQSQLSKKELAAQERAINYEVRLQAAAQGINPKHLEKVARLIERSEIQLDADGTPTNIKDLLTDLVKDMPELLVKGQAQQQASGGATNPSRSQTTTPQALSEEVIARMTPEEYQARRGEIQQWKNAHPYRFGQR